MNDNEPCVSGYLSYEYTRSLELANELLDINSLITKNNINALVSDCLRFGITEFTMSSDASGLLASLTKLEQLGWQMDGLLMVQSGWEGRESIPAIKVSYRSK